MRALREFWSWQDRYEEAVKSVLRLVASLADATEREIEKRRPPEASE